MKTVFVVSQEEAEKARTMEQVLMALSEDSGIIFVGISVIKNPLSDPGDRKILYRIIVGCSRSRDPDLVSLITRAYLREVVDTSQLAIEVYRGITK